MNLVQTVDLPYTGLCSFYRHEGEHSLPQPGTNSTLALTTGTETSLSLSSRTCFETGLQIRVLRSQQENVKCHKESQISHLIFSDIFPLCHTYLILMTNNKG